LESPVTPEFKPNIYLYGPSKGEAIRLGLGKWFEALSSSSQVTTVDRLDSVEEGIFISFNPLRELEDAFPQLGNRIRKWICIEDDDSFAEGCRIAKEEAVDRLIHNRLMDEMRCPVIPSAILLLMEKGIWLSDTDIELGSDEWGDELESGPVREKLLWLVRETGDTVESEMMPFTQIARELFANRGWKLDCFEIHQLKERALEMVGSRIVFAGKDPKELIGLARLAGRSGAKLAICQDLDLSPIRFSQLGSMFPYRLPGLDGKLREAIPPLLSFVEETEAKMKSSLACQRRETLFGANCSEDVLRMRDRYLDTSLFWDCLMGDEGDLLVEWCRKRIDRDSRYRYSPLYYAVQYFEEFPGFQLLCDEANLVKRKAGIERIRAMLELGLDASGGYGAMFGLYLGWCHILLDDHNRVLPSFEKLVEPQFSAVSLYVGELALALWFRGSVEQAKSCIEFADSLRGRSEEWPVRMIGAIRLLKGSEESSELNETALDELRGSEDWVTIAIWALALGQQGTGLVQTLEDRAPDSVKGFFEVARNRRA